MNTFFSACGVSLVAEGSSDMVSQVGEELLVKLDVEQSVSDVCDNYARIIKSPVTTLNG